MLIALHKNARTTPAVRTDMAAPGLLLLSGRQTILTRGVCLRSIPSFCSPLLAELQASLPAADRGRARGLSGPRCASELTVGPT